MSFVKAYLDLAEGQLHYASTPGTGTPLVFFHQTASSLKMWAKLIPLLGGLGAPCYAFDTPGFGGSFDPQGETSMPRYAGWMAQAIEALAIGPAHIIGHHTGAAISAQLVVDRPDLAKSVTLCGPLTLTPEERVESARHAGAPFVPEASGAYLMDNWAYLTKGGAATNVALIHREMTDMLRAWTGRSHAYGAVWAQDFTACFTAIACPLQIVCAPDDILWPYFDRARTLRPDATAVVLSGGSNFEPDLAPDEMAKAIADFVKSHD